MGVRDTIRGLLAPPQARQDASPAPPAESPAAPPATQRPGLIERMDSIFNSLTGLGGTYDKGTAARPAAPRELDQEELKNLYEYNGIARRIVDLVPFEGTRKGWRIHDDSQKGNPFEDLDRDLHVRQTMREAWCWSRLFGAAVVVMVTDDGKAPSEPLDPDNPGELHAVHAFDAVDATPLSWEGDPYSTNFRHPDMWQVRPSSMGWSIKHTGLLNVHSSRLLWFRGARRPSSRAMVTTRNLATPDQSILQIIWDETRRLTTIGQAGAILAQEIQETVLRLRDGTKLSTGDEASAVERRVQLLTRMRSLIGTTVLLPGEDYETRSKPPNGFAELSEEARTMLSGVTGYPQVVLFGDTPSGMNTDGKSAWQQFNRLVSAAQEDDLRDNLEYFYRVAGAATGRTSGSWRLEFEPLDVPSKKEIDEGRLLTAQRDQIYIGAGVLTPERVERSRFGDEGWQDEVLPPDEEAELGLPAWRKALEEEMETGAPEEGPPTEQAAPKGPQQKLSDMAMNGAQIKSALEIVQTVADGSLPRDTGIAMLTSFFQQLTREQAESIMGDVGIGFSAPRADVADDSWWVGVVLPPQAAARVQRLASEAAEAIDGLSVDDQPHTTVLYLGRGLPEGVDGEVVDAVKDVVHAVFTDRILDQGKAFLDGVEVFPEGPDGWPIVLRLSSWLLEELHHRLLRRLAHLVTARQFQRFRAHVTLGYASEQPSPAAIERLTQALHDDEAAHQPVPLLSLDVRRGGEVVESVVLGAQKRDADKYKLPESARNNAKKVLRWREEHPDEIQGMTEVGWRRARQLATQTHVGIETVKKMAAFARHRANAEVAPEHEDEPWKDAGYVAWLGWGGTTGIEWAREITGAAEDE